MYRLAGSLSRALLEGTRKAPSPEADFHVVVKPFESDQFLATPEQSNLLKDRYSAGDVNAFGERYRHYLQASDRGDAALAELLCYSSKPALKKLQSAVGAEAPAVRIKVDQIDAEYAYTRNSASDDSSI